MTQKKMKNALICSLIFILMSMWIIPGYEARADEKTGRAWISVEAGHASSFSINADKSLWAWGWNEYGQLGDGTTIDRHTPIKVMDGVAAVSAGQNQTMAIKTDGSLWAWGWNINGQLGDGTTVDRLKPIKILENVLAVSTSGSSTLAIKTDGSLWAWGLNGGGSLGDGTFAHRTSPVRIMDDVVAVSAGGIYSMAIKTDGSLWAWGTDISGQLGDGTTGKTQLSPIKIMDDVAAVSARYLHTAVVKTDGSLWAWGWNAKGQLGDGTTIDRLNPTRIMDDVVAVSAGWYHTMVIKADGSLWAWGQNNWGELGDGSDWARDVPDPIRIRDDVVAVSAGDGYTIAIIADGNIWAWGGNNIGRLGDGTDSARRTPIKVEFLPDENPELSSALPSSWAVDEVNAAITAGLIPHELQMDYQKNATRGEVAQLFINLIEKASGQTIDSIMTDNGVSINNKAFTDTNDYAVLAANALGIIQGVGDNKFDPDGILTRAQIAVIINRIARVMGLETDGFTHTFTDINEDWIDAELGWPVYAGIIQGVGDNKFNPGGNLSVEMAIVIAFRALTPLLQ